MKSSRTLKRLACIYKGEKCTSCGLEVDWDNLPAFVFHHVQPKGDSPKISVILNRETPWKEIKKELDKCELMCANCHTILHTKQVERGLPI